MELKRDFQPRFPHSPFETLELAQRVPPSVRGIANCMAMGVRPGDFVPVQARNHIAQIHANLW